MCKKIMQEELTDVSFLAICEEDASLNSYAEIISEFSAHSLKLISSSWGDPGLTAFL